MDESKLAPARAVGRQSLRLAKWILDLFFHPRQDVFARLFSGVWLVSLLVYGVYLWGVFFSWGNVSFDFLDWGEVAGPRYALLRDAAMKGVLPLHASTTTGLRGVTDRYLAIADTPFSPQFFFMRFFDELGQFVFADTILFYVIGYFGLVWLYRKYHLSLAAFTVLFLVFNFNGHMVSHIAVGHLNWVGHFLLPYFVLAMLAVVEGRRGWMWVFGLAVTQLIILLQGDFHLYVWSLIFMGALGIAYPRLLKPILIAGLFIGLVAAFRLLPPVVDLARMDPENLNGFPTVTDLVAGLIVLREPGQALNFRTIVNALAWWELDTYIGLVGLGFLAVFGIYGPLRKRWAGLNCYDWLLTPCLVVAVLSLGEVYHFLTSKVPIPLFAGERVTSRFLIVPLVVLFALGAIAFQRFLDQRKQTMLEQVLLLVGVFVLRNDLLQHMKLWRIRYIDGLTDVFPKIPVNLALNQVSNHPDPVYTNLLLAGALLSAIAVAFLIFMVIREQRQGVRF